MKKTFLAVISVILCLSIMIPVGVTAFAEAPADEVIYEEPVSVDDYISSPENCLPQINIGEIAGDLGDAFESLKDTSFRVVFMNFLARLVNTLSNILITVLGRALGMFIPKTSALGNFKNFNLDEYGNFYAGMSEFLDAPAPGAKWHLGYAKESILPDDFGEVPYTMGGYGIMAETTETFDDLSVRTIVINDGSGRGNVVFAVLDAIGIANADVRLIREAVADFAAKHNIVSVNISVTHTHSGIDLQGVWDHTLDNVLNNIFLSNLGITEIKSGVNRKFLATIIEKTAKTVVDAYNDMTAGTLTLAKKDIGDDYLRDRTAPYVFDGNMYRLEFTPDDANATPTIISTFSAHPENSGYGFTVISGDFIPYLEEVMNDAGYNFIYIQGCIGTITYTRGKTNDGMSFDRHEEAVRYGYEIAYMLLGLTKTEKECAAMNLKLGDRLGVKEFGNNENYSVWYEDWYPVKEEVVAPMLNIAHHQYIIEVSNCLMDIIGKIGITDYCFLYDKDTNKYYTVTENGYMELGDSLKVAISPGETYGELLMGGKGLKGFKYPSLREMYGEDLIVFDLMNDAIGYIEPDDDFVMAGMQYSEKNDSFDGDTWCLISFGKHTASKVISEFIDLVDSVR